MAFASCSKTKEIKITEPPKELILNVVQNIEGVLGQFSSAKNEKIKISFKKNEDQSLPGFEFEAPIKINFTTPSDIKAGRGYNNYGPRMEIEFLDKEGKIIENCFASMNGSYTDLASLIKSGNKEEWVNFGGRYIVSSLDEDKSLEDSKKYIEAISRASSIRIKSEIIAEKIDEHPNESAVDAANRMSGKSSGSSSSGGGNCDEFLEKYEEIVMAYISAAKKMKADSKDMSGLAKVGELAGEAKDIESKFQDCKNDPKIAAKYTAINMKMLDAMR